VVTDDPQDVAESLDDDEITGSGDLDGWVEDGVDYPPDRPQGVNAYGITAQEEEVVEPFDERVAHSEPDPLVEELDRAARYEPRGGPDYDDVLGQPAGKLMGDDLEDDEENQAFGEAVDEEDDLSAEEAAIHVTEDPDMGSLDDGYLSDEN
jgi:hypothetical protein